RRVAQPGGDVLDDSQPVLAVLEVAAAQVVDRLLVPGWAGVGDTASHEEVVGEHAPGVMKVPEVVVDAEVVEEAVGEVLKPDAGARFLRRRVEQADGRLVGAGRAV